MNQEKLSFLMGTMTILDVAAALGLEVAGRNVKCFNGAAHQSGHDENPSMVLFSDSYRFKCFACGLHGDVIDLVKAHQSCSFHSALEWLSQLAGSSLSQQGFLGRPAAATRQRYPDEWAFKVYESLFALTEKITKGTPESLYLWGRGLRRDVVNSVGARRVVNAGALQAQLSRDFDDEELVTAGLISSKGNFLLTHRSLVFFYLDGNRVVYWQARDITGRLKAKELNPVGLSSPVPFNSNVLRPGLTDVYVCEGCIDTLSATQSGLAAVGVPGVDGFQEQWFSRFSPVKHIHILFDNDAAGQRAGAKLRTKFLLRGFNASASHVADGVDVNDALVILSKREGV